MICNRPLVAWDRLKNLSGRNVTEADSQINTYTNTGDPSSVAKAHSLARKIHAFYPRPIGYMAFVCGAAFVYLALVECAKRRVISAPRMAPSKAH